MIDRQQKRFLAAFAALLAKMAAADGRVTDDELMVIDGIWKQLGLSVEQRTYCAMAFNGAVKDGLSVGAYAKEYVSTRFGKDARSFLYELLWEVACADGILHHCEHSILTELPKQLKINSDAFDFQYSRYITFGKYAYDEIEVNKRKRAEAAAKARQKREQAEKEAQMRKDREAAEAAKRERQRQKAEAQREEARKRAEDEGRKEDERRKRENAFAKMSDIERAYATLGCDVNVSNAELKKAYYKAAKRWHPDCLGEDGVSEVLIAKANAMMQEINVAWKCIKDERGL